MLSIHAPKRSQRRFLPGSDEAEEISRMKAEKNMRKHEREE